MFYPANIKKFRKENDLSHKQVVEEFLSKGVSVSMTTLMNWEKGITQPRASELDIYSQIVSKPISLFFVPVTYRTI